MTVSPSMSVAPDHTLLNGDPYDLNSLDEPNRLAEYFRAQY